MVSSTFLFGSLLAATVSAAPQNYRRPFDGFISRDSATLSSIAIPASTLTDPASMGMTLQHVGLASGTQNYTCANSTATPKSNGAKATLLDVSSILTASNNSLTVSEIEVGLPELEISCPGSNEILSRISQALNTLPVLGQHFFAPAATAGGNSTPTFDITSAGQLISGKVSEQADAPSDSCPGTNGNGVGAVPWLYLAKNDDMPNNGDLKAVYRVSTAGGKAPTSCEGYATDMTVPYSALYFFYA